MTATLESTRRRSPASHTRRLISDWWYPVAVLATIIGSDYKFRIRDVGSATSAGIDAAIIFEIGLYGLVGLFVIYSFRVMPKTRRVPAHVYLAGLFICFVAISATYSPYVSYSAVRALQGGIVMTLVLAATQHADRAHFHRLAHGYLLLICGSIFYGLVKPSPAVNPRQVGRFTWFAIHPTVSGFLSGLAVVLVVSYLWRPSATRPGPKWPKGTYLLIFAIVLAAMLVTQTRGAIGAALLGIVTLCIMRLGASRLIEVIIAIFVISATVALSSGQIVAKYFARGEDAENLATLSSRTELWAVAWEAIVKKPMYGYGIGAARGIFYTTTGLGGGHNAVVNTAVELGLVGLTVWLLMVVAIGVGAIKLRRYGPADAGLDRAMIVAILVFLLFDGIFFEGAGSVANAGSTWLFVLVAWLAVAQRMETAAQSNRTAVSISH